MMGYTKYFDKIPKKWVCEKVIGGGTRTASLVCVCVGSGVY